ncbi:RNA polymerase sigma factor [Arthrobacter sp. zg-Y20]|uniref:RNA polymerase sigma factor n=1 Tax=unclassified Arthrobacter TaxID=235627 RepID=UPI001D142DF5|nr:MULTISPECIES: RNA polymerase sigma factor [unclassified Arthrobacter]MCC3275547.1 RNA polymerase sigma factor [Arthrobacter sp. zg-Y20]MDK1315704.1 RNA polymerase sigma factor [Arthrobacter sp. zg.Y20]WIB06113.1 RNA polymerase sigma factor [Arthrobacter sp. zg-Y20]
MKTDKEIVELSRSGPSIFGELYDRHAPDIYRYAARRAGDFAAEDVMAETFLIAFERRAGFTGPAEAVRPWLFGIATNLLRRHHRAEARMLRALVRNSSRGDTAGGLEAVDAQVDADGDRSRIGAALQALAPIDREAILLYAWADLTYDGIATAAGVPVGTVRSRINRARRKLRADLGFALFDEMDSDHGRTAPAARNA